MRDNTKNKHNKELTEGLNKTKGYTLVELIVAVTIFAILVAAPTGIFVSSLKGQNRALILREITDNASYVAEYMSRSLRMALKDDLDGVSCLSGDNVNYELEDSNHRINFKDHNEQCHSFYLENGRIKEERGSEILFLTSDDLEVKQLEFRIYGENQDDDNQPRVTLSFEIEKRGVSNSPAVKLQTTVSQRNLDVLY